MQIMSRQLSQSDWMIVSISELMTKMFELVDIRRDSDSEGEVNPLFDAIRNKEPDFEKECFKSKSEACINLIKNMPKKDP